MKRWNPPAGHRVSGLLRLDAANEDEAFQVPPRGSTPPVRESGWDPYEVWRTRVKVPQAPGGTPPKKD